MGHFGWYCDIMEDYATCTISLTNLIRKETKFVWSPKCQAKFDVLKAKLIIFLCLIHFQWNAFFYEYCDALAVTIGAVLYLPYRPEQKDQPITFASCQLTVAKWNYSTTKRGYLAIVFSMKKFCHYL